MVLSVQNNNPGNMRPVGGSGFQKYDSPQAGLAAMRHDLMLKVSGKSNAMKGKFGADYEPSLANVISTWAPSSENDTANYINTVAKDTGLAPDTVLTPADIDKLIPSMIKMEGGSKAASYFGKGKEYADAGNVATDAQVDAPETFNVTLPSGETVQGIPIGTPKDQIKAKLEAKGYKFDAPQEAKPEEPGFLSRVGDDLSKRGKEYQNIIATSPDQNPASTALQLVGKTVAGTAGDIIGEGISAVTPDVAKSGLKSAGNAVLSTDIGELGLEAAKQGADAYSSFKQAHPEAAADIESVVNIGSLLPVTKGASMAAPLKEGLEAAAAKVAPLIKDEASAVPINKSLAGIPNVVDKASEGAKTAISGLKARGAEELDSVIEGKRAEAGEAYKAMRDNGVVFKPEATGKMMAGIEKAFNDDGIVNERLHDKVISVLSQMKESANAGDFGLEKLDQWRQLLGEVAGNFSDPTNARKASLLINKIDEAVEKISPSDLAKGDTSAVDSLLKGRQAYSQTKRFESVANIIKKADGDPNRIKAGFKRFIDNPKNLRGFSPEEVEALRTAARYTVGEGLTKALGKFGYDLGTAQTMGNTLIPTLSAWLGSPALTAAGTAAKVGQKGLARAKAENALNIIEKRKYTPKEIGKLPPKEAQKVLKEQGKK